LRFWTAANADAAETALLEVMVPRLLYPTSAAIWS